MPVMVYTWDEDFEALPEADVDDAISAATYGPHRIVDTQKAIVERDETEHNFMLGYVPYHKAGLCSVVYVGTTLNIAALDAVEGCVAYDTDEKALMVYHGDEWIEVSSQHSGLQNLTDYYEDEELVVVDDHPQYLHLRKEGQTLLQDITLAEGVKLDGRDIVQDRLLIGAMPTWVDGFGDIETGYVMETVYGPETQDCIVMANGYVNLPGGEAVIPLVLGYIGLTSTPDIKAASLYRCKNDYSGYVGITFIVPKGYYWKVTGRAGFTITKFVVDKIGGV